MTPWFFSEYLRRLLEQRDWTANKLGDRAGISHSFVGTLLRGGRSSDKNPPKISVDTLIDLAKALKVSELDLLLAYKGIDPDEAPGGDEAFNLSREVMLASVRCGREWDQLAKKQRQQVMAATDKLTRRFVDMTVEHELERLG
jgi:transcriptional regulator with XRE-family HTH domain